MRITTVTTKTGDQGTTSLAGTARVKKDSTIIHALGEVDELNSWIGKITAQLHNQEEGYDDLRWVQHRLFDLGGELAVYGDHVVSSQAGLAEMPIQIITEEDVDVLTNLVEEIAEILPPLENFILPGGNAKVADLFVTRAIARRAERSVIASVPTVVGEFHSTFNLNIIKFLNRLSDYLFVLARSHANGAEVLWEPKENPFKDEES